MRPINIFFSCAHGSSDDRKYIEELEKHLAQLQRDKLVNIWHVHKASPGVDVEYEIHNRLKKADIILLCVSRDYVASDYCVNFEANRAILMENKGIAIVRALLLRPVHWKNAPFGGCRALPSNEKFVSRWNDRQVAFLDIAQDIRMLVVNARANYSAREAMRKDNNVVLNQTHVITTMPPAEVFMLTKQIEEVKLERKTDEVKISRRTEELKQRKLRTGTKQRDQLLAAEATLSEYAMRPRIRPLPSTPKRNYVKKRGVQSTRKLSSTSITNWLESADKKYRFMSRGYRGVFFYGLIIIDALGISTAFLFWSHSWIVFALIFIFALSSVIIGAVNTGSLIPLPLALIYGAVWGVIISHYLPLSTLDVIVFVAAIIAIHIMLFHNYRLKKSR